MTSAPGEIRAPAIPETGAVGRVQRLDFLDGMRAMAALYVLIHHAFMSAHLLTDDGAVSGWYGYVFGWALWGHFGVTVFIVLAGYSLALGVARHDGRLPGGFFGYMKRRTWRIVPPYWIALTLTIVVTVCYLNRFTGTHWDLSLPISHWGWFADYLLLQEVMPVRSAAYTFWSISIEYHIYLLLPVMLLVWRWWGFVQAVVFGAACGVVGVLLSLFVDDRFTRFYPTYYLVFALAVGACIAGHRNPEAVRRVPWRLMAVLSFGTVIALCTAMSTRWVEANYYWVDGVVGIGTISMIVAMRQGSAPVMTAFWSWRPLAAVAAFSYSLYLIHAPLLQVFWQLVIEPFGMPPGAQLAMLWLVACPLIVGAAYLFYQVAEKPFLPQTRLSRDTAPHRPAVGDDPGPLLAERSVPDQIIVDQQCPAVHELEG